MPCRPQSNEPWSVDDCMNVVPQVYPSDVTTAMFLGTLGSREHDLQIYSSVETMHYSPVNNEKKSRAPSREHATFGPLKTAKVFLNSN